MSDHDPTRSAGADIVLSLSCPDRTGIVAAVTHFIASRDGLITEAAHFVDDYSQRSFMRTRFRSGPNQTLAELRSAFADVADPLDMEWDMVPADARCRVLVAVSQAPAFDLEGQARAVAAVNQALAATFETPSSSTLSGAGVFGVSLRDTIRAEATWRSLGASAAILIILFLAYRSLPVLLLAALPLLAGLVSGFPRQTTGTLLERLLIPLIHFVLLGYLPVPLMRRSTDESFAAGCGQLFVARRDAYTAAGGHAAIRGSRHDGLGLPVLGDHRRQLSGLENHIRRVLDSVDSLVGGEAAPIPVGGYRREGLDIGQKQRKPILL